MTAELQIVRCDDVGRQARQALRGILTDGEMGPMSAEEALKHVQTCGTCQSRLAYSIERTRERGDGVMPYGESVSNMLSRVRMAIPAREEMIAYQAQLDEIPTEPLFAGRHTRPLGDWR